MPDQRDESDDLNAPSLLDPADWEVFRAEAHRALDMALDFVRDRQHEAVWQEPPRSLKVADQSLPSAGQPIGEVVDAVRSDVMPFTLGNTHPRFWGWVNGSGTPSGIISQSLVGALNANLGGRDHSPIHVERQLLAWMRVLFGYPEDAGGRGCTGTA